MDDDALAWKGEVMNRRSIMAGGLAALAARPAAAHDTSPEMEHIEIIRHWFDEIMPSRNAELARVFLSPDFETDPADGTAPGVDAFIDRLRAYFAIIDRQFTEYVWEMGGVIADGGVVVWQGRERGTTTDGRLTDVENVTWFGVDFDGSIRMMAGGADRAALFEQMYG